MTMTELATMVTAFTTMVKDGISIFLEPPLVWFTVLGLTAAVIGTAKSIIPKKKAKA